MHRSVSGSMAFLGIKAMPHVILRQSSRLVRRQVDSKVLESFEGMDDAQLFLTEIKKERPYFTILAEKTAETLDSIFSGASAASKDAKAKPFHAGVTKPRVRYVSCRNKQGQGETCPSRFGVVWTLKHIPQPTRLYRALS